MDIHDMVQDMIGENGVLLSGVLVFAYLDENGDESVGYAGMENPSVQTALGIIEMAKHNIASRGIQNV